MELQGVVFEVFEFDAGVLPLQLNADGGQVGFFLQGVEFLIFRIGTLKEFCCGLEVLHFKDSGIEFYCDILIAAGVADVGDHGKDTVVLFVTVEADQDIFALRDLSGFAFIPVTDEFGFRYIELVIDTHDFIKDTMMTTVEGVDGVVQERTA